VAVGPGEQRVERAGHRIVRGDGAGDGEHLTARVTEGVVDEEHLDLDRAVDGAGSGSGGS
jgi:hypothetical protein